GQTSLSDRYIKDHLGSVQKVIRENGTEENEYIYDSFGNIIYQSGTFSNQRLYTSRYYDSESGLYYYRARYYDSNTGRFISEDPIELGSYSLYAYVGNNPINFADPYGLIKIVVPSRYGECMKKVEESYSLNMKICRDRYIKCMDKCLEECSYFSKVACFTNCNLESYLCYFVVELIRLKNELWCHTLYMPVPHPHPDVH
ncbi:MAG: RHS repeat-associated core domain-containing protein, partial [Candidatus Nanoarchaeia archaeon]|nr:RHS repeat-associated core domain-containing protein [Candidatus Jingweiarchaeum tengchongense]